MPTAAGGRSSRTTRFRPNRISPIARRLINEIPMPNIPGAAVGADQLTKSRTSESGGPTRATSRSRIRSAQNDLVSVRYSLRTPARRIPATFGIYGGLKPFAGTGTNPTQSVGGTYNRVWSATLVQEIRFGRTHHHNEAIRRGLWTEDIAGIRHQRRQPERRLPAASRRSMSAATATGT